MHNRWADTLHSPVGHGPGVSDGSSNYGPCETGDRLPTEGLISLETIMVPHFHDNALKGDWRPMGLGCLGMMWTPVRTGIPLSQTAPAYPFSTNAVRVQRSVFRWRDRGDGVWRTGQPHLQIEQTIASVSDGPRRDKSPVGTGVCRRRADGVFPGNSCGGTRARRLGSPPGGLP